MSPAGRPPLSGERKNIRFIMMLNELEREHLDAAAAIAGKPVSTWARDLLLEAAHAAVIKKKEGKKH